MYHIFPKGDLIGTCTQDFCCKRWGDSNMQCALLFSVSCPLEFHNLPTRCQYGTKQTCHSVLSDACLDAAQQAMFGCG